MADKDVFRDIQPVWAMKVPGHPGGEVITARVKDGVVTLYGHTRDAELETGWRDWTETFSTEDERLLGILYGEL